MVSPSAFSLVYPSFQSSLRTVIDDSVIVQVVIYYRRLPLGGHLQPPLLAEGGERVVDIQLAPVDGGPQGAKARRRSRDVDVVVVVRRRVRVRVGLWVRGQRRLLLLLLGWRCAARSPGAGGEATG